MGELKDLDDLLKSVQNLETRLLRAVLGSFLFSLLPVAAVFEGSDWSLRAEVELLGGLMGAAGFLAAYLGSIRNPLEEPHALEWYPLLWGTWATVIFSGAGAMLYLFYVYGKASDPTSLLFLGPGTFWPFTVLRQPSREFSGQKGRSFSGLP